MKTKVFLCGAMLMLGALPVMGQNVTVSDLETGIAGWSVVSGYAAQTWMNDGGADSTANYLRLTDGGYGAGWGYDNSISPPAGNYKLQFWYRNGVVDTAMKALNLSIIEGTNSKVTATVPNIAQTAWTMIESAPFVLTGGSIKVDVVNQQGAGTCNADLDQIVLVPITSVPLELEVWPSDSIYLSGTENITATPKFGTESYTKVEFDINNDGTVESTDTSAPFEYSWDTTVQVAVGTSRTLDASTSNTPLDVKIKVTDSNNDTAEVINSYTVDNRWAGRVSLITNGDFSQWQATDGSGNTLPVGWVEQNTTETLPVYGPYTSYDASAGDALQITMTNAPAGNDPFPQRYALRTVGVGGNYHDLQTYFWGQGTYCRLMYMLSTDGGVTYRTTQQSGGEANSATWKFAVQDTPKNLGLSDSSFLALGTHQLTTDPNSWDDIVSQGILYPENAKVGEWRLY